MNNNAKKYNAYNGSMDVDKILETEDIESYPQDSYVKPGDIKNVGKLDDYNKDKQKFDQQKQKVVLKESKISNQNQEKKLDDLIPSDIGNVIDNVFSTVDNLLSVTGKFFFSGKKKEKSTKPVKPVQNLAPRVSAPVVQQTVKPVIVAKPQVQQIQAQNPQQAKPNLQNYKVQISPQSQVQPTKTIKKDDVEVDNSPLVTRTTTISDLDLPLEILNDPDVVKYFDQMKLYEKKVDGGLCSKTQKQVENILKKGRWGKLFMISFDRLKINSMMVSADAGLQRFNGMSPVYKALGRNFTNTDELKKAIEDDINMYLKNGEGSGEFHKFTYKINRKK